MQFFRGMNFYLCLLWLTIVYVCYIQFPILKEFKDCFWVTFYHRGLSSWSRSRSINRDFWMVHCYDKTNPRSMHHIRNYMWWSSSSLYNILFSVKAQWGMKSPLTERWSPPIAETRRQHRWRVEAEHRKVPYGWHHQRHRGPDYKKVSVHSRSIIHQLEIHRSSSLIMKLVRTFAPL